jgi:RHH-type proline utilization regulon transcriptional repressor/proline dehydrogenase/delta 1-pyrroline-5-carboxylate dehydrogenase
MLAAEDERRIGAASRLGRDLVLEAAHLEAHEGRRERRHRARMHMLVADPAAADFAVHLTDEIPRIPDADVAARRFSHLVADADLRSFTRSERWLLRAGSVVAPRLPRIVMALVMAQLRADASAAILLGDDRALRRRLAAHRARGLRSNVNVLGEAIVGREEARARLEQILQRLALPDVQYVSVKISSICANLSSLAFDDTVGRVVDVLRGLYAAASRYGPAKLVTLDMEEYRDLDLTVAAFRTVLDEERFRHLDAGIVLQAYLPDTRSVARELGAWAVRRRAAGGGRIKVRLVKGANLAMEQVDAELRGWGRAPYDDKADVDANYKAVLDVLLDPDLDDSVRVGVGSHNLFDVAWALGLAREHRAAGRPARIEIEMLEGMAPAQAAAVRRVAGDLLLYTPVVASRDFPSAVAYLVRRLDENTSAQNFLAHLFDLAGDPEQLQDQADRFAAAVRARHTVSADRRRRTSRVEPPPPQSLRSAFANAPDTDWTDPDNRRWIADALDEAEASVPETVSSPPSISDVDEAVHRAVIAGQRWAELAPHDRAALVNRVGDEFEAQRGRIIATMTVDTRKTVAEGDPEVSEGVDLARYYARAATRLSRIEGAESASLGPVVVSPPWNFPFAIPAGGVLAALAAGNPVILKPAPQSRRTAELIAELCWNAGIDRDVLQCVPAEDDDAGRRLITHPDVAAVVLTGAHATARMFLEWRPDLRLHAETSGKNAMVVTACADLDRAVVDLARSAFGNAGQKCSAASLAIVDAPILDDSRFLERLRDAAATLRVGPADDLATEIGPLIGAPGDDLWRALTSLDPGEEWLLRPEPRSDDQLRWSPGIRVGVQPGSWFARTECFGPVLGIIRAHGLDDAIRIQNDSRFGLTAGLQSLDPDEIARWTGRVEAGSLYVNRGITGAIVRRQPFGGWKHSAVGPTAKAGGPNYVATLAAWRDTGEELVAVANAFERWMRDVGDEGDDETGLAAEQNVFRYRPLAGRVLVRCGTDVTARARDLLAAAATATRTRVVWSETAEKSPSALITRLAALRIDRLRMLGADADTAQHDLRRAAHAESIVVDDAPPVSAPEIELPRWLREQSVTITSHRHGRLAGRRTTWAT